MNRKKDIENLEQLLEEASKELNAGNEIDTIEEEGINRKNNIVGMEE